jgi:ubiquinone/menaquinone biosynthesis C-methylase UbiE
MLDRAVEKWEEAKKQAKGNLRLIQQDVTRLELKRRFDMAFIAFNTFLTLSALEQREAALQRVRRHLKPGGRFVIDVYHAHPGAFAGDQPEHRDFAVEDPETGNMVERYSWDRRDASTQQIQMSFEYRWTDPSGQRRREATTFPMCVIYPIEMQLLLGYSGFEIERVYGDHGGARFEKHSPRMIVVARKTSRTARR